MDTEKHHPILKGIMGSNDDVAVSKLNSVLMTTITNHAGDIRRPVIFLHYSPYEHTYNDQIKDLISELRLNDYTLYEDNDYSYEKHSESGVFFRPFITKTLNRLINQ